MIDMKIEVSLFYRGDVEKRVQVDVAQGQESIHYKVELCRYDIYLIYLLLFRPLKCIYSRPCGMFFLHPPKSTPVVYTDWLQNSELQRS